MPIGNVASALDHGLAGIVGEVAAAVMARLSETPLVYPVVYREVRRAVLHRFPFLVW